MTPNPFLKKLGLSDNDRAVIIHTDDIGMCHASVQAFKDLWAFGTITSGATMVPCPWFPAVAQMCRENPEMDMGVHTTLNAEWEGYRWSPISTTEPGSGLMDEAGYFHRRQSAVYENAVLEAVDREVNAQIERALTAGIDVTHVDSHMGTILNFRFVQAYARAASKRLLPALLMRPAATGAGVLGIGEQEYMAYVPTMLESIGVPLVDAFLHMPLGDAADRMNTAKRLFGQVPAGITHLILHPSIDTAEVRAIAADWPARVADYNTFMSDELKMFIEKEDVKLIGYRAIRNAMRN